MPKWKFKNVDQQLNNLFSNFNKKTKIQVFIASFGVLVFLIIAGTATFNNKLFSQIFLKPFSHAATIGVTYYVSPIGNDTNLGTLASPWKTLLWASAHSQGGDTIYLRAGTYDQHWAFGPNECASDSKCARGGDSSLGYKTFQSYPGETAIITNTSTTNPWSTIDIPSSESYLKFINLDITRGSVGTSTATPITVAIAGNNVVISGSHIHDSPFSGISTTTGSHDNTIDSNEIDHNGRTTVNFDHGVYIEGSNQTVSNNKIHDNGAAGIKVNDPSGAAVTGINLTANTIYNNGHLVGEAGILVSCFVTSSTPCSTLSNVNITKNIIYKNFSYGVVIDYHAHDVKVINNTFYSNGQSQYDAEISIGASNTAGTEVFNVQLANNILAKQQTSGVYETGTGYLLKIPTTISGYQSNNNLFNPAFDVNSPGGFNHYRFTVGPTSLNLTNFKSNTVNSGQETTSLPSNTSEVDPQFVNPTSFDFHLKSTSPAIGKGVDLGYGKDIGGYCFNCPQSTFTLTSTSSTYPSNTTFSSQLKVRTDTDASNLFTAKITFPANLVQVQGITTTGSFITSWVDPGSYDNLTGTISIIGGVSNPGFKTSGADALMATINFKTLTGSGGPASLTFDTSTGKSAIYRNSDNINILTSTTPLALTISPAVSKTYYVDCSAGNDTNNGTSQTTAWKTLAQASTASLQAGDSLLLKKGCTFNGTLTVAGTGTSSNNITVSNYGLSADPLPIIQNPTSGGIEVNVTGIYITIDGLATKTGILPGSIAVADPTCPNQPSGYRVGFQFTSTAHNDTLQNSQASDGYAGVYVTDGSHDNKILHNQFLNNNMMNPVDTTPGNDAGAFGVLLHGDTNQVSFNTISGSNACSYDYGTDGSAVELYGGKNNVIDHNRADNNAAFSELGNSRTDNNTFAYNLVTATLQKSDFLNTRGYTDSFGPVTNTYAYNNTVYLTGSQSQGVICGGGCATSSSGGNILTTKNNIIWVNWKAAFASQPFIESNNIYWKTGGSPLIQGFTPSSSSKIADPKLIDVVSGNFGLLSTSPAVNTGSLLSLPFTSSDFVGATVPTGSLPDIGAYEFTGPLSSPTPTIAPTASPTPPNISSTADCTGTNVNCPDLLVQGDPYVSGQFYGYADPSMRHDPLTNKLWMSYSYLNVHAGTPTTPAIDIHLASSDDNGKTWQYQGPLFPSTPNTNKSGDGGPGYDANEVSNILPIVTGTNEVWYGARWTYFVPTNGGYGAIPADSMRLQLSEASTPQGLRTAQPAVLGGATTSSVWGTINANFSTLAPSLANFPYPVEPSLYYQGNTLYLLSQSGNGLAIFSTQPFNTDGSVKDVRTLIWNVAGMLITPTDAQSFGIGATGVTQGDLVKGPDGQLLLITTPWKPDPTYGGTYGSGTFPDHFGCWVLEVASINPPTLARDTTGQLKIRDIVTATDLGVEGPGSCTYDPLSSTGLFMARRHLHDVPETSTINQTGVQLGSILSPTPTSSPTPSPTPTPVACSLTSATWSNLTTNPITSGSTVNLTVNSIGDCSGKTVSFVVSQDNGILPASSVTTNPLSGIFIGNTATSSWTSEYQPDGPFGIFDPPEYYFRATLTSSTTGTSSVKSSNPELQVNKSTGSTTPIVSGPGDGNGDGVVNLTDLSVMLSNFTKVSTQPDFPTGLDINNDGIINSLDFASEISLLRSNGSI